MRWSLSAASSMDTYAAGALIGGGNARQTVKAPNSRCRRSARSRATTGSRFQRLPDECVADIELLACATPTPAPHGD